MTHFLHTHRYSVVWIAFWLPIMVIIKMLGG
jgi:hypothetical protein